jgi:hypothetical protein
MAASFTTMLAAPAYALRTITYVASYGTDSGACSYTAPCRNFAYALSQVQAGGTVEAIDSAGYSGFTINMAVTIQAPAGVVPNIIPVSSGGDGIDIYVGPNDAVVLRGLTLNKGPGGNFGIFFGTGGTLTVENTSISGFNLDGLRFAPYNMASNLFVSNSQMSRNGISGIYVYPFGDNIITEVSLNHVETNNNGSWGTHMDGTNTGGLSVIESLISDSVSSGNGQIGYYNNGTGGHIMAMMIFRSVAYYNQAGNTDVVVDGANANTGISRSMVGTTAVGSSAAGTFNSWGDNTFGFAFTTTHHEN